jgi:hypothetical protein
MSQLHTPDLPRRVRPHKGCPNCHSVMFLSRIVPDQPGTEVITFACEDCGHSENTNRRIPWPVSADL